MFKNMPPYQRIGWFGSILLVITVAYYYQFRSGELSGFWDAFFHTIMIGSSLVVLLMAVLEIGTMVQDYRQGFLYPMRTMTLFVSALTLLAMPILLVGYLLEAFIFHPSTMLLLPVFLYMCIRAIFRVRIDNVSLYAKVGFRPAYDLPLFGIQRVTETERNITIETSEGQQIVLLRAFFFPTIWEKLRERLSALG
ncbi:MAG: hypothetical protein AAGA62_12680 [Bacteroidota bacterium]